MLSVSGRVRLLVALTLAALLRSSGAFAQTASTPPPGPNALSTSPIQPDAQLDPAVAMELTRFFDNACLHRFPDDAAMDVFAAENHGEPLSAEELKRYLHDDPGRGWYIRTSLGLYALTLEAPPFHACAIRRMTPTGIKEVKPFLADVQAFAASHALTLVKDVPRKVKTPQGLDITMFPLSTRNSVGGLSNNLMIILSNYHGRAPSEFRADAGNGPGVEVRMVRQDYPPSAPPTKAAPPAAPAQEPSTSSPTP